MTTEEKKEQQRLAKNAYMKEYTKRNKAKKEAYDKMYREQNKETIAAKRKEYYSDNKEAILARDKAYCLKNRDKKLAYYAEYNSKSENKARRRQIILDEQGGLTAVYYLKEEHYVGVTKNLRLRMNEHRSGSNRHVEDVEVLGMFETREEGLAFEAKLHSMGYNGANIKNLTK